jgi:hypothetical protein
MAYKLTDRAKEWTTYAGIAVAGIAAAVPDFVPVDKWTEGWQAAQLLLGAAMIFIPQSTGTTAVENELLSLMQALAAKVPTQYQGALQPFMAFLARVAVTPNSAPVTADPGVTVSGVPVPQPTPVVQPAAPVVQQPVVRSPQKRAP